MFHSPSHGWSRRDCCLAGAGALVAPGLWAKAQTPTLTAAPELASVWPSGRSPQGFAVSEKFDGVRALWDGRALRFRSGRPLTTAPDWWLQTLPPLALDGELWLERGAFAALSGLVRTHSGAEAAWRRVRYQVFDAPGLDGRFAQRWQRLRALSTTDASVWRVVEQRSITTVEALRSHLREVVRQGGEGVVLHDWSAPWQAGRSDAVFKFKPVLDDEAEVVGYRAGQGKYAGLTGALVVRDAQGRRFALGSGLSDAMRRQPPPVGSWVTYGYQGRTATGLPRFAHFVRVRPPE